MTALAPFLARVEASTLATTIGQSTLLNGLLSGIHLLGLTLIVGGVLVSSLRLLGVLLPDHPVAELTSASRRAIVAGLAISVTSGLLLLSPKAAIVPTNTIFQTKMLLLSAAVAFYFAIYRRAARGDAGTFLSPRLTGALGLALWTSVALAGCAFILLD